MLCAYSRPTGSCIPCVKSHSFIFNLAVPWLACGGLHCGRGPVFRVADVDRECSPWRNRALPSCRSLVSTWHTYKINPRELGLCPPKRVMLAGKSPVSAVDFCSQLSLWTGSEKCLCKKWMISEEVLSGLSVWAPMHPELSCMPSCIEDHSSESTKARKPNHRLRKLIPRNHFEDNFLSLRAKE